MKIEVFIPGLPKGKPSARGGFSTTGGKLRFFPHAVGGEWAAALRDELKAHIPKAPWMGPVEMEMIFVFPPLKAHKKTLPKWKESRPDLDNLEKLVCDVMTALRIWEDDARVVSKRSEKTYGTHSGLSLKARTLED